MAKGNTSSKPKKTKEEIYIEKCLEAQSTWSENNFDIQSQTEDKITYVRQRKVIRTFVEKWYIFVPLLLFFSGNSIFEILFGNLSSMQQSEQIGRLLGTVIFPFLLGLWVFTKFDSQKIVLEADVDAKCPKEYHLKK